MEYEVYTVSGLIMMLFLASRAACGGGVTEGPCPLVGELTVLTAESVEEQNDVVAS